LCVVLHAPQNDKLRLGLNRSDGRETHLRKQNPKLTTALHTVGEAIPASLTSRLMVGVVGAEKITKTKQQSIGSTDCPFLGKLSHRL